MSTPKAHAVVSASSFERWSHCTAAPRYEEQFPSGTTEYAEEGTLAHSVCELFGKKKFKQISTRKFNSEIKKLQEHERWKDEMLKTAEFYANYLAEIANVYPSEPFVVFEKRVDLTDYIPEGFGSCDCIMIGGDTLRITDYKHGTGIPVSSVNNGQMRLYALGALKFFQLIYGDAIKKVYNLFESDAFIILIALPAVIPIVIFSVIGRFFVLIRRWIKQNMKELRESRKDGKSTKTLPS